MPERPSTTAPMPDLGRSKKFWLMPMQNSTRSGSDWFAVTLCSLMMQSIR